MLCRISYNYHNLITFSSLPFSPSISSPFFFMFTVSVFFTNLMYIYLCRYTLYIICTVHIKTRMYIFRADCLTLDNKWCAFSWRRPSLLFPALFCCPCSFVYGWGFTSFPLAACLLLHLYCYCAIVIIDVLQMHHG